VNTRNGTLRERAIALQAVDITIRNAAAGRSGTIGELAESAIDRVCDEEANGELVAFYEGFVRDPDPDGDPIDADDVAAIEAYTAEQDNPPATAIGVLLRTSDFRGDHAADVSRLFAVEPGETVQALVARILEVGPHAPSYRSNTAPDVRVDHIEIRLVQGDAVVTQTAPPARSSDPWAS
jgi:hypothetical protein